MRGELPLSADVVEKLSRFGAVDQATALISFGCAGPSRISSCCGHYWL